MKVQRECLEIHRAAHDFTAALELARDLADELSEAVEELRAHVAERPEDGD